MKGVECPSAGGGVVRIDTTLSMPDRIEWCDNVHYVINMGQ